MQNQLVEQLLSQMLQQQQPNIAKGGFLGQIALAAALRSQMKQAEQKQQAQQKQLVDVIQPDAPTTLNQVFGQQSPQNQRYWGQTKSLGDAVDAKRAALGALDMPTLQGILAKQMSPEPMKPVELSEGEILFDPNTRKEIGRGRDKPVSSRSPIGDVMTDWNNGVYGPKDSPAAIALRDEALEAAKRGGVSVTVNNPGNLKDDKPTQRDLYKTDVSGRSAINLSARIREQVRANPAMGIAGILVRGGEAIGAQASQLARITGASDSWRNPDLYSDIFEKFSWLGEAAGQSAAVKSNLINLAFLQALAYSEGRAPTDKDVRLAMESIGGSNGSVKQLLSALDETDATIRYRYKAMHDSLYPDEPDRKMPDWVTAAPEPISPSGVPEGFNELPPEKQQRLLQLLKKKEQGGL